MTSDDRTIRRWLAIALSTVLAVYCVFLLASIGTARAFILAIVCGTFPLVAWLEARRLRGRNHSQVADNLLLTAAGVQLVLMMFVSYAAELAELATSCGYPPQ